MPILNSFYGGGSSGGGGNIGEPLNLTVTSAGLDATITWEDNEIGTIPPTSFAKSELVRKVGSAPTSPSDGTLVVTETVKDTYKVSGYIDQGLTDGTTYYYRVFSYSDLGGISYCDAVSVTISNQWGPGVNTMVYLPLDGDIIDGSDNHYTFANNGNAGFSTLSSGIQVLNLTGSQYLSLSSFTTGTTFTISMWINISGNGVQMLWSYGGDGNLGAYLASNNNLYSWAEAGAGDAGIIISDFPKPGWDLLTITHSGTTRKFYLNGNLITTKTISIGTSSNQSLYIGSSAGQYKTTGQYSKFIMESVIWSDTDVSNYYNQTKGNYGL